MLTIVIPTRNRSERLFHLIKSFEKINKTNFNWEVLVVDNSSTDSTRDIVKELSNSLNFKINYYYEKNIGLHYARNSGVRESKTQYLVFLDDDMLVTNTWLDDFDLLLNGKTDAYVGKILPYWESRPPWWLKILTFDGNYPYLGLLDLGNKNKEIEPIYLYGGNLFIKREIILKLKGFNPDGFPTELIRFRGDGEGGLMKKFKLSNFRAQYVPSATVYHVMSSSRTNLEYLCKRAYNEGISNSFTIIREKNKKDNTQRDNNKFKKIIKLISFNRFIRFLIEDLLLISIKKKIKKKLKEGFDFHQNEVKNDKKLYNYVLKESFLND